MRAPNRPPCPKPPPPSSCQPRRWPLKLRQAGDSFLHFLSQQPSSHFPGESPQQQSTATTFPTRGPEHEPSPRAGSNALIILDLATELLSFFHNNGLVKLMPPEDRTGFMCLGAVLPDIPPHAPSISIPLTVEQKCQPPSLACEPLTVWPTPGLQSTSHFSPPPILPQQRPLCILRYKNGVLGRSNSSNYTLVQKLSSTRGPL